MRLNYAAGVVGPGDRKSVQLMAARGDEAGYDQLHHFVAAGVWNSTPLEMALLSEVDRLVGGAGAFVIDDTAMPKKGRHGVGVAPQYASSLGKNANCHTMGVGDAGISRGAGDVGVAPLPARELDRRSSAYDESENARRSTGRLD